MSITIQLVGSASAIFGEYRYTARGNGHDPIPPLVRSLLAEKVIDADVLVTVARGDLVCFGPCRAILWAEIDVVDTDDGLVRRPAYIGPHARGALAVADRLRARKGRTGAIGRAVQAEARA